MTICACAMPCRSCPPPSTVRQASEIATARQSLQTSDPGRPLANSAAGRVIGGDLERADGRGIGDDSGVHGGVRGRARPARIGPAGVLMKVLDQKVDEAAD